MPYFLLKFIRRSIFHLPKQILTFLHFIMTLPVAMVGWQGWEGSYGPQESHNCGNLANSKIIAIQVQKCPKVYENTTEFTRVELNLKAIFLPFWT